MVNVEIFMLAQLKHLNACIIQKSDMCKIRFFCDKHKAAICHVHCHTQPGLSGLYLLAA